MCFSTTIRVFPYRISAEFSGNECKPLNHLRKSKRESHLAAPCPSGIPSLSIALSENKRPALLHFTKRIIFLHLYFSK